MNGTTPSTPAVTIDRAVRAAMGVLAQNSGRLYIDGDRDLIRSLTSRQEWTPEEKRRALMLFHKYRRFLISKGVDYYSVFPKSEQNRADIEEINDVSKALGILQNSYGVRPPRNYDLMPFEELRAWTYSKVKEVIYSAKQTGETTASAR